MKSISVVIGIGEGWDTAAKNAAGFWPAITGWECAALTDPCDAVKRNILHPSWLKCHLLEIFPGYDRYLALDADIIPLQKWDPDALISQAPPLMAGVLDFPSDRVELECRNYRLEIENYLNCGLLCFSPEHHEVFERAWRGYPGYGTWLEQTAINKAIQKTQDAVAKWPAKYNRLAFAHLEKVISLQAEREAGTVNLHLTQSRPEAIIRAQELAGLA